MSDFDLRYAELRRAIIEQEFAQLNDRQKDGVFKTEGPVLILAGAGSGKTTVLINRIINLLKYGSAYESNDAPAWAGDGEMLQLAMYLEDREGASEEEIRRLCTVDPPAPWQILAITFTNKAAGELRERLNVACGAEGADIWAQTFHSCCARILRSHITKLGYSSNFAIYDEDDKKKLIISILRDLGVDEKRYDAKAISSSISKAKDELKTAEQFSQEAGADPMLQITSRVFLRYEAQMQSLNALDFDDMIVKTVELLRTFPDVLEYYQRKFRYVLVDEYQDTNHAQYVLCKLLSDGYRNICVVGDDDQSIYKFRGATIANILEFEDQYPDAMTIRLEQNYRSTGSILNAANGLIAKNRGRKGKNLWTDKGDGEKVVAYIADNQEDEAQFIATRIKEGTRLGNNFREYAILYRNHVLSNSIEYAFKRNGIPYRIVSGLRFFDRAEVKDMLSYLCVIDNPSDTVRLRRIINVPTRGIGATTQDKISLLAQEKGVSDFDIIKSNCEYPELSKASAKLDAFCQLISEFDELRESSDLLSLYDILLDKSGYMNMLATLPQAEQQSKTENVLELRSNITHYCETNENPTLRGFLEEVALFTDVDRFDPEADAVTMMTIHSAKGLEFDNVFICGAEEGIFPSERSMLESEQLEEERRLCYVAVTRARKQLYITASERRMLYGRTSFAHPSRFIAEIPRDYINKIEKTRPRSMSPVEFTQVRKAPQTSFVGVKKTPTAPSCPKPTFNYRVGQTVQHKSFGEGIIQEVTPMGNDAMLTITFGSTTKRLMAKTASQFMKIIG